MSSARREWIILTKNTHAHEGLVTRILTLPQSHSHSSDLHAHSFSKLTSATSLVVCIQ